MGSHYCEKSNHYKTKTQARCFKKRKEEMSKSGWAQHLADKLHKPITCKFTKRRVLANGIDEIWAADLAEMGRFSG